MSNTLLKSKICKGDLSSLYVWGHYSYYYNMTVLQALYIHADAYWHHSSLCTKHTAVIQLQSGCSKAVVRLRFGPNVPLLAYKPHIKYYGSWSSCQAVVRITAQCLGRFSVILA